MGIVKDIIIENDVDDLSLVEEYVLQRADMIKEELDTLLKDIERLIQAVSNICTEDDGLYGGAAYMNFTRFNEWEKVTRDLEDSLCDLNDLLESVNSIQIELNEDEEEFCSICDPFLFEEALSIYDISTSKLKNKFQTIYKEAEISFNICESISIMVLYR